MQWHGIVIPSLLFGFNVLSHVVLIIISFIPLLFLIKKHGLSECKKILLAKGETSTMNKWIFLLVILPITILIVVLLTNHILVPKDNGGVASGQSTYGDLNMHLAFITGIAEQGVFPPNYVLLSGHKLNYPFFAELVSSSMFLFGTSLRMAVLIPSYVISFLLVIGFYYAALKITNKKSVAILATIFFFLCGGFGFSYFLDGARENTTEFTRIFTDFYHTPTNFNENNIRWSNTICDMIIPQRTLMAGWCVFLPCLWILIDALKNKSRKSYILIGIIAGCLPMIHTHSFLALGIICAVMFFAYLIKEQDKKNYIINWLIFGGITAALAVPQLFFWTFQQTSEASYVLKFHFNWVNKSDPYIWFYIKNWGIAAIFAIPAVISANKDNKKLFLGAAAIFVLAEAILFQPNEYDNNKLFYISYMITLILVSDWLVNMWEKLKDAKSSRIYLAIVIVFLGTFSGILSIGREMHSGGQFETFSKDMLEMSEYIKENTPKDAVFLTGTSHINPVCSLAGRNVYVGSSIYVYFHGFGNEQYVREVEAKEIYKSNSEHIIEFCKNNNIDYIYVGTYEKSSLQPNMNEIDKLEKIITIGTETLYKIN